MPALHAYPIPPAAPKYSIAAAAAAAAASAATPSAVAPVTPATPQGIARSVFSACVSLLESALGAVKPSPPSPPAPSLYLVIAAEGEWAHCIMTSRILMRLVERPVPGLNIVPVNEVVSDASTTSMRAMPAMPSSMRVLGSMPTAASVISTPCLIVAGQKLRILNTVDDIVFALFGSQGLEKSAEETEMEARRVLMGLAAPPRLPVPTFGDAYDDEYDDGATVGSSDSLDAIIPDRQKPTQAEWNSMISSVHAKLAEWHTDPPSKPTLTLTVRRTDPMCVALVHALNDGLGDPDALRALRVIDDTVSERSGEELWNLPVLPSLLTPADAVRPLNGTAVLDALGLAAEIRTSAREAFIEVVAKVDT